MFFSSAFACLGVIMALLEIASFFEPVKSAIEGKTAKTIIGAVVIAFSFIYAYCKLFNK